MSSSSRPIIFSIYIPHVFPNIKEGRIRAIFYSLRFGFVERVDIVKQRNREGNVFNKVFVHFSDWNFGFNAPARAYQDLVDGKQLKIEYDKPWFWIIQMSKSKRPEEYVVKQNRSKPPRIVFFPDAPVGPVERANAEEPLSDTELLTEHMQHVQSPSPSPSPSPSHP